MASPTYSKTCLNKAKQNVGLWGGKGGIEKRGRERDKRKERKILPDVAKEM